MYTPSVTARCLQDTQQNKMVYSISVLAYFHATPSGVVFSVQTCDTHEFFRTSNKMPRAVLVALPGRTLACMPAAKLPLYPCQRPRGFGLLVWLKVLGETTQLCNA